MISLNTIIAISLIAGRFSTNGLKLVLRIGSIPIPGTRLARSAQKSKHLIGGDDQGGSCSGTVKVAVPHSKKDQAGEGAQLYNSFAP